MIAGCRHYDNYEEAKKYIDFCISRMRNDNQLIFISGCCRGADALGERYAEENGFKIQRFPAEWGKYGKSAGPRRNRQMVEASDYVICFWDGKSRGTMSLIDIAVLCNKPIGIKRISTL